MTASWQQADSKQKLWNPPSCKPNTMRRLCVSVVLGAYTASPPPSFGLKLVGPFSLWGVGY